MAAGGCLALRQVGQGPACWLTVPCASEEEEEEEDAPPKTVKKTVWDWEVLNDNKAIWLRPSGDVSETEYDSFYKAISKARPACCRGPAHASCGCRDAAGRLPMPWELAQACLSKMTACPERGAAGRASAQRAAGHQPLLVPRPVQPGTAWQGPPG